MQPHVFLKPARLGYPWLTWWVLERFGYPPGGTWREEPGPLSLTLLSHSTFGCSVLFWLLVCLHPQTARF